MERNDDMDVIRWLAASLAISSGLGGGALAADAGCTPISSLPFVVESPGTYCVTAYLWQNNIVDTAAQAEDAGGTDIFVFGAPRCQVLENRMVNTVAAHGQSVGVMVWSSPDCVVSQSEIDNRTTTALDVGVYIIDS